MFVSECSLCNFSFHNMIDVIDNKLKALKPPKCLKNAYVYKYR